VVAGTDSASGSGDGVSADLPAGTVDSNDPSELAEETESAPEPPEDIGPDVLDLGDSAKVGHYEVAVKSVEPNANDIIDAANTFNEPPKGQYVLVTIRVTYVGGKEGDPWIDLTAKYVGTDNRQYDSTQCDAVVPKEAGDVPTLQRGGSATYQECFDMRPSSIKGGQVFVEDALSFSDESRMYWSGA
jgi:hypothetical protein